MLPASKKPRTATPRTVESGLVLKRPTEAADALDRFGVATFPLANQAEATAFVTLLRGCTDNWFHENLELMLTSPPPSMFASSKGAPHTDIIEARATWNALTPAQKQDYERKIDLRTDPGMQVAFDDATLQKQAWFKTMPGSAFFRKAVSYVKMGNVGMGLGNMPGGWTASGFGKWAHIPLDIGLPMMVEALKVLESFGLEPGLPGHFPHAIYKPPSGKALEIHHDQMAPRDLIARLNEHVASADPSTTGWVKKFGLQMLAHLQGGTGISDGATFVVGPMTPAKLLLCLDAFAKGRVGAGYADWITRPIGKINLDWEAHMDAFNAILAAAGHAPIGLVPAAPLAFTTTGFGLAFPVGWPHGSFSNAKEQDVARGKGSRITVTLPLALKGTTQQRNERIPTRLQAMALIASAGHSQQEYERAEAWLANDKCAYADGSTHEHPQKIVKLLRHPDAAAALGKPVGPYWAIVPRPQTVENYLEVLERLRAGAAAAAGAPAPLPPPPPSQRPTGFRNPPPPSVLDADVRILKVKQPWAGALVAGKKDVENRSWALTPSTGFSAWVIVASSKWKPTRADLDEYQARLRRQYPYGYPQVGMDDFELGSIVGIVKVKGCYPSGALPWPSVWHNSGDVAWVLEDAWEFQQPVVLAADDLMQTQAGLATRPQYRARIEEEIAKLEPGFP